MLVDVMVNVMAHRHMQLRKVFEKCVKFSYAMVRMFVFVFLVKYN